MKMSDLQKYVDEHIPIVEKNGLVFSSASADLVRVEGKLRDHTNHRASVFGGSLSTALILASWARVRMWTDDFDPEAVIVIAEQTVRFLLPVLEDFATEAGALPADFLRSGRAKLERFGKIRLSVPASVCHKGDSVVRAEFMGEFVVVGSKK